MSREIPVYAIYPLNLLVLTGNVPDSNHHPRSTQPLAYGDWVSEDRRLGEPPPSRWSPATALAHHGSHGGCRSDGPTRMRHPTPQEIGDNVSYERAGRRFGGIWRDGAGAGGRRWSWRAKTRCDHLVTQSNDARHNAQLTDTDIQLRMMLILVCHQKIQHMRNYYVLRSSNGRKIIQGGKRSVRERYL